MEGEKNKSGWCLTLGLPSHLFFLLSFLWDIPSSFLTLLHIPQLKTAAKEKTKTTELQVTECSVFHLLI